MRNEPHCRQRASNSGLWPVLFRLFLRSVITSNGRAASLVLQPSTMLFISSLNFKNIKPFDAPLLHVF
jgi:hypothetical protein